jgi:hypothetical protein
MFFGSGINCQNMQSEAEALRNTPVPSLSTSPGSISTMANMVVDHVVAGHKISRRDGVIYGNHAILD